MCIIACKPFGISTLENARLKNMFENNPDGAGFAIARKGQDKVDFQKGLMKFDQFETALKKAIGKDKLEDMAILLHFRITTHGGTSQENTHPFMLTNKDKLLKRLRGSAESLCAMNGIVDVDMPKKATMSDTMYFIKSQLSFLYLLDNDFWKRECFDDYISECGAKWAFIDKTGIMDFGAFHTGDDGWRYSNKTYETAVYYYSGYKTYSAYEGTYFNDERIVTLGKRKSPSAVSTADTLGIKTCDYSTLYSNSYATFTGVLYLRDDRLVEVDEYDGIYISDANSAYLMDYETGEYFYITNLVKLYDINLNETSYNKITDELRLGV